MYCRNCGKQLDAKAVACMNCGFDPRKGNKHCPNCGVQVEAAQIVCVKCGVSLASNKDIDSPGGNGEKDKTVFLVLAILLGSFGAHNFYAGYTTKGIVQLCISLLSCGMFAIVSEVWGIIEGVTVEEDAAGRPFRR